MGGDANLLLSASFLNKLGFVFLKWYRIMVQILVSTLIILSQRLPIKSKSFLALCVHLAGTSKTF